MQKQKACERDLGGDLSLIQYKRLGIISTAGAPFPPAPLLLSTMTLPKQTERLQAESVFYTLFIIQYIIKYSKRGGV
ncbi:hypothetical protein FGO68_gene2016 [Halteria grandinella]|uniref:Uncharacterized protein n=1 Tax=Halteria grandinella TaxID=5974 RepID=A0A8J8T3J0_HALGN|nr:hypothetical protein FGO68_gene2016 [Halteria grandinella]